MKYALTPIKLGDVLGDECFQNGIYKHADSYGTGTPILRISNFDNLGRLMPTTLSRVELSAAGRQQFSVRENDVLINRVNSLSHVGKSMFVPLLEENPVFESNMMRIRIGNGSQLVPEYVAAVLQAESTRRFLKKVAKAAIAQVSINQDDVRSVRIFLYPIEVQKRTADALAEWNTAIEKTEQLIAAKENYLKAIDHQLLTARKRLNGFSNNWELLRADKIFDSVSLKGFGSEPLLSVTQDRGVIPRDMLTGRVTMPSGDTTSFKLVEPGNFVISLRSFQGGLEHSAYRGLVSPAYTVLRATREIDVRFFRHYFRSADFIKRLSVAVIGIRDGKQVSFQDFCSIKIPFPPVEEQQAIATMLDEAEREIALLRDQVTAFKKQKRGLMQKLLTGQWRVKVPEVANQ